MKSPGAPRHAHDMPKDYATVFTNAKAGENRPTFIKCLLGQSSDPGLTFGHTAGMAGVDKEHIKRVVYEMSKASTLQHFFAQT